MACGWLRHLGGTELEVYSAGTKPKGVHPLAVQVMAEAGVDISGHSSDHVDQYAKQPFDLVITVCDAAKEACPVFPAAGQMIHKSFDDPDRSDLDKQELLAMFRRVRDEIRSWAADFVSR